MRIRSLLALLFAAAAGAPRALAAPEYRPHRSGRGTNHRAAMRSWERERAERRLVMLELGREARTHGPHGGRTGAPWRRERNAAKRRRRAIRAAGGQA